MRATTSGAGARLHVGFMFHGHTHRDVAIHVQGHRGVHLCLARQVRPRSLGESAHWTPPPEANGLPTAAIAGLSPHPPEAGGCPHDELALCFDFDCAMTC
jgi:hypothetical protein